MDQETCKRLRKEGGESEISLSLDGVHGLLCIGVGGGREEKERSEEMVVGTIPRVGR